MTAQPHRPSRLPGLLWPGPFRPPQDQGPNVAWTPQRNQSVGRELPRPAHPLVPILVLLCAIAASSGIAAGAPITVTNASFENPANSGSPTGWTVTGNTAVWRPNIGIQVNSIPDGIQTAYIFGPGSLTQDLGVATQSGMLYSLAVWVGTQINLPGSVSYSVSLWDGPANSIASTSGTRNQLDPFTLISISGVASGAGTLRVVLTSTGGQPLFDSVQVFSGEIPPSGVPEPSSLTLVGLAGLFVAWRKRNSI